MQVHAVSPSLYMVDSGCEDYVSREQGLFRFTSFRPSNFSAANGTPLRSYGIGDIRGLSGVTCLPDLSFPGLISTRHIIDDQPAGSTHVVFSDDGVRIVHDPNLKDHIAPTTTATGCRIGNLYYMKPEEVNLKSASASTKSRNRAVLHHRRAAHSV